jgi:hypothetical protein
VASAVQLTNRYLKIAIYTINLFNRIRDAPKTIRKRIKKIKYFFEITRLIEHNFSFQISLIASVLTRINTDADELFKILTKIDI